MRLASLLAALAALSLTAGCVQNRSLGDSFGDATTDLNLKRQLLTDRTIKTGDIDAAIAAEPLDPSTFKWSAGFGGNGLGRKLAAGGAFDSPKKLKF